MLVEREDTYTNKKPYKHTQTKHCIVYFIMCTNLCITTDQLCIALLDVPVYEKRKQGSSNSSSVLLSPALSIGP